MSGFIKAIFKLFIGIVVLLGIALGAFFIYIDMNNVEDLIAKQSKDILGRPVIIAGKIRPGLSIKSPSLVFNDVTFKAVKKDDVEIHAKTVVLQIKDLQKLLKSGNWQEEINFNVELIGLKIGEQKIGFTKMSVTAKGMKIDIKPLSFKIFKSGFYGELHYSEKQELKISGKLSNFNYGQFSEDIEGKFDANIALASKGSDLETILNNLNGKVLVTAGEGKLSGKAIDLWAADFITTILPIPGKKKYTKLVCGVGLFEIKNGQADSKIIIDTDNVLIKGKGNIDIPQNKLALKFIPKPKNPSLLNMATPLNVTGNWADPSITPTAGGVLKKLGGILLGAVNPAALALPFLKLGSGNDNPCVKMLTGEE